MMIGKLRTKLAGDIHLKEMLMGSAITFVLKMTGMLLGYLVVLIISRKYGAEGIGQYNLMFSIIAFLGMIGSMGMNVSILRYVGQFNKEGEEYKLKLLYRYALEFAVPISILLAIIVYFFSENIALYLFQNSSYNAALELVAIIMPFMVLQNISVEFIRGLKKLKVSEFLRSISRPIINISLLLIMNMYFVNKLLPIYTLGTGIILSSIAAVYFVVRSIAKIKYSDKNIFLKSELIKTSIPMMFNSVIWFLFSSISLFMLGIYASTEQLGIYSVAMKVAMIINIALIVINTIVAPKISSLYWSKNFVELKEVLSKSAKLIFILSFIISIPILLFSIEILRIFGNEFILGKTVLIILVLGQLAVAFFGSTGILMSMTGHQSVELKISASVLLLSFVAYIILVPIFGMTAAAYIYVLSMVLWNFSIILYLKFKLNIISYFRVF